MMPAGSSDARRFTTATRPRDPASTVRAARTRAGAKTAVMRCGRRLDGKRAGSALEGVADRRRRREQDRDSRPGRDDRGLDLGRHATEANAASTPPASTSASLPAPHLGHEPRVRTARVTGVEPSTSESSTSASACDEMSHECSQPIVVAEADLVRGDGVVLVHDRGDSQRQQAFQAFDWHCGSDPAGRGRRRSAAPARPAARGGRTTPRSARRAAAGRRSPRPAGSRDRVVGPATRAGRCPPRSHPRTPGRLAGRRRAGRPARRRAVEPRRIEPAGRRERRRADLDDDPVRSRDRFPAHEPPSPDASSCRSGSVRARLLRGQPARPEYGRTSRARASRRADSAAAATSLAGRWRARSRT